MRTSLLVLLASSAVLVAALESVAPRPEVLSVDADGFSVEVPFSAMPSAGQGTMLSQAGLDYLSAVTAKIVEATLTGKHADDIHDDTHTAIGHVTYDITNIHLTEAHMSSFRVQLAPGKEAFSIHFSGCRFGPHVSKSGSCDASTDSLEGYADVQIGRDSAGHPTLAALGSHGDVANYHVKVHTGMGWLVNLITKLFKHKIHENINKAINDALPKAINNVGKTFTEQWPLLVPVTKDLEVSEALVSLPVMTSQYMIAATRGEYYKIGHHTEPPFKPTPLPTPQDSKHHLGVLFTEYFFNSANHIAYADKDFTYFMDSTHLPPGFPWKELNTKFLREMLPNLYKLYPNHPMEVNLYATKAPHFHLSAGSHASIIADAEMAVVVIEEQEGKQHRNPVFTLAMEVSLTAQFTVTGGKTFTGKVSALGTKLSLAKTEIGPFDVSALATVVDYCAQHGLKPYADSYLQVGYQIPPVHGVTFSHESLKTVDQGMVLEADIHIPVEQIDALASKVIGMIEAETGEPWFRPITESAPVIAA